MERYSFPFKNNSQNTIQVSHRCNDNVYILNIPHIFNILIVFLISIDIYQ